MFRESFGLRPLVCCLLSWVFIVVNCWGDARTCPKRVTITGDVEDHSEQRASLQVQL